MKSSAADGEAAGTGFVASDKAHELEALVAEVDLGGRTPSGAAAAILTWTAIAWSFFQLWYASPLPFVFGVFILNDTEARSIHLAFGLFLAFTAYPALASSPRRYIPALDWVLAAASCFCAAYLVLYYRELAARPGTPIFQDLLTAAVGVALLIEATRRTQGGGMVLITIGFMLFCFAGPYMPDVIAHKGVSISKFLQHMWLTTEGVFGVAIGVSVKFVFLFVLFGSLLDKAGGKQWMMQIAIALLGPLNAAVRALVRDGTVARLTKRWLAADPATLRALE